MEDKQTKIPFKKLFLSVFLARILSFVALITLISFIIGIILLFDAEETDIKKIQFYMFS